MHTAQCSYVWKDLTIFSSVIDPDPQDLFRAQDPDPNMDPVEICGSRSASEANKSTERNEIVIV